MSEHNHTIRRIDWHAVFPFTHLFRSFRIAVHPSKLILAFFAILIIYSGGRALDGVWGWFDRRAAEGEIEVYERLPHRSVIPGQQIPQQLADLQRLPGAKSHGLFAELLKYELDQIDAIANGVLNLQFTGPGNIFVPIYNFAFVGPGWAISTHPFYFTIFFLFTLAIVALFGGAIARIAAVHVAHDEKLSIRQALRFSFAKFLSFYSAPLIPVVFLLFFGLLLFVAGLLVNIPYVGPVVVGAGFIFAIAVGVLLASIVFGTIGGMGLMYPTIAVEGSDSFDAISRSYSYVFARPWRLAFYSLVAIIYGSVTYLFLRLIAFLLLRLTHFFVGAGVFTKTDNGVNSINTFDRMWPGPAHPLNLSYPATHEFWGNNGLTGAESFGAVLLSFWIYLVIALLGAYLMSLYFSANTLIYFLMRSEVDATEMDEVYVDPADEDYDEIDDEATTGSPVDVVPSSVSVDTMPSESSEPKV